VRRWSEGWIEPVSPPPSPRHIVAQQVLALALQENAVGIHSWREWWGDLPLFGPDAQRIFQHLLNDGYLDRDGDLAFVGPEAEKRFGRRHFSDLTAVFSAAPEFLVLAGREEIGNVGTDALLTAVEGPRVLLLAGRTWQVNHIDWKRRRCYVEPSKLPGLARWGGNGGGLSFALTRGMREVLLGASAEGVTLTRRAMRALDELQDHHRGHITADSTVVSRSANGDLHWWTWAGTMANRTLHASLPAVVDRRQRVGDWAVRLHSAMSFAEVSAALREPSKSQLPEVNHSGVQGLKFSSALPADLAHATVAERLVDTSGFTQVLTEPRHFTAETPSI
jgi:ATP-dependent Lhr-like helicase